MDFDLAKIYAELDEAWDHMNEASELYDARVIAVEREVRLSYDGARMKGDSLEFRIKHAKDIDDMIHRYFSKYNYWRARVNTLIAAIRLANDQKAMELQQNTIKMLSEISEKLSRVLYYKER